jgi:hypothetical protein
MVFPSGRIRTYDNSMPDPYLARLGYNVAVPGAKVRARKWFTTKTALTDPNGYFRINHSFRGSVNYSIVWERTDWDIRVNNIGQAIYNGPKSSGSWNPIITGGASRMCAMVHIALNQYYYGQRFGLKSPPKSSFWKTTLKLSVYEEKPDWTGSANGHHCKNCRFMGMASRLRIYDNTESSRQLYSTTIHEIAHASHWELRKNNWNDSNTSSLLKETWAPGVALMFTQDRYGISSKNVIAVTFFIIQDLIDVDNAVNQSYRDVEKDPVSGFSLKDIENVLLYSNNMNSLKQQLKLNYNYETDEDIDILFETYKL